MTRGAWHYRRDEGLVGVVACAALCAVVLAVGTRCSAPAAGGEAGVASVAQASPGPIYDLPRSADVGEEWYSFYVHDRRNREWVVIGLGRSFAVIPSLDEDGAQVVAPQA